jgi:hypothetical protein
LDNNLWKLEGQQISTHRHKCFLCEIGLNSFHSQDKLNKHKAYRMNNNCAKIILPEPYNNITISKSHSFIMSTVSLYANFNCMLGKIQNCQPDDKVSYINPH